MSFLRFALCAAASCLIWTNCSSSLPKLKPYAFSTARMAAGIEKGREDCRLLLSHGPTGESLSKLEQQWDDTVAVVRGMQAYTQTLAGVLDLGDRGSGTARAVADGVDSLMSPVGLKGVSSGVVKTAEKVDLAAARARARKELKEAISEAHPAVVEVAKIAQRNLLELEQKMLDEARRYEAGLVAEADAMTSYYAKAQKLEATALDVLAAILEFEVTGNMEILKVVRAKDGVHASVKVTPASIPKIKEYWHRQAVFLQSEKKRFQADIDRLAEKIKAIRTLSTSSRNIASRAVVAVQQWAQSHGKLKQAMKKSKPRVDFSLFKSVVEDLEAAGKKGCEGH